MASRVGLLVAVVVGAAVAVASSAAPQPPSGTAIYVVRTDKRLCPSPLCGGYWVAIANGARTRCANGLLYPQCYVARAVAAAGAEFNGIPEGSLVRGAVDLGRDDLGELAVSAVFAPAGEAAASGRFYRLVDNAIRCVRAPCFSTRASRLNRPYRTTTSGLVLSTLRGDEELETRVLAALATRNGVLARGRIQATPDGGRVFYASRFYLRAP